MPQLKISPFIATDKDERENILRALSDESSSRAQESVRLAPSMIDIRYNYVIDVIYNT